LLQSRIYWQKRVNTCQLDVDLERYYSMMRRHSCLCALTLLILSLVVPISQAQDNPPLSNTHLEWPAHSVTPEGRVRVTITKQKPKLHLARTQRPVVRALLDDRDDDYYDETPDFQVGYRRPELVDQTAEVHDDISDEIKIRLVLARMRALQAYHANWG
jgi:hypothetical protein